MSAHAKSAHAKSALPYVVHAPADGLPLAGWLGAHWPELSWQLDLHGALLLRGFRVEDTADFHAAITPATPELLGAPEMTSDYPAERRIRPHNELSDRRTWPGYVWLWCELAAPFGGCITMADFRNVYFRLSPATRELFATNGVMYDETDDAVQAVVRHPRTGANSWFNQIGVQPDRPVRYGDGSPIPPATLREISNAIEAETVRPDWRSGDVAIVDNLSVAYGREPFEGPRQVVRAMAAPMHSSFTGSVHA